MKNVSVGNWLTISIVAANIIFMVAFMSKAVLIAQLSSTSALTMAHRNDKKIAVMESKIEQGFKNLENLIKNGH